MPTVKASLDGSRLTAAVLVIIFFGTSILSFVAFALGEAALRSVGEASIAIGPLLAIVIAASSQRRPIGGWLLCYYVQIYTAILFTSHIFARDQYDFLAPKNWDSAERYVMFLLSTLPLQTMRVVEVIVGTRLLIERNPARLHDLRWVLIFMLVVSAGAVCIDIFFFPTKRAIFADGLAATFSIVWLAYFWRAKRVRAVFVERSWDYAAFKGERVLTPEDKRKLGRRAVIVFSVTFAVLLVLMGLAIGDKKPDFGIFVAPIFCAAIAAAIAWSLPLRKGSPDES